MLVAPIALVVGTIPQLRTVRVPGFTGMGAIGVPIAQRMKVSSDRSRLFTVASRLTEGAYVRGGGWRWNGGNEVV